MPASLGHVDETAAVVAKDMIRQCGKASRIAVVVKPRLVPGIAESRVDRIPFQIVADIEVEVAVIVEVGPCRRCRPIAIAAEPRAGRHVLEPALSEVVIKGVGPPSGDEEVGPAVVVEVAHGDPVAVAPGQRGQAGRDGRVLEPAVAAIAEEAVTERKTGRAQGGTVRPERRKCRANHRRRSRGRPHRR